MWQLGSIGFAAPWILTTLLALPLIWWLLRITPPAPQRINFPSIRLLLGFESAQQTPQSSPLWLIILRSAAIAALILGLAGPLMNARGVMSGSGPVLLVVDDGWASASNWTGRLAAIESAINWAKRDNRPIALLTTAKDRDGRQPTVSGPFKGEVVQGLVSALQPKPWPVDRAGSIRALESFIAEGSIPVIWFSNGLGSENVAEFALKLKQFGSLEVFAPPGDELPMLVFPPKLGLAQLVITAQRLDAAHPKRIQLRGRAEDGRLLVEAEALFKAGEFQTEARFDLPLELRNRLTQIDIDGETTAAAVALLDDRWKRHLVGLAASRPFDKGPSLLSDTFYLEQALLPFSETLHLPIDQLLRAKRTVIVIPDSETTSKPERADLDRWIRGGGIVVRFAGPVLAASESDDFTPVPLRRGGRTLGGISHWSVAAQLAAFSDKSPFYGLDIPKDIKISRQVLAQPSLGLSNKTWASLTDGTPLVTAEARDKGWLVLVHTTASTAWSNLALSGLFVDMLRRVVQLSQRVEEAGENAHLLAPFQLLNAFGRLEHPSGVAGPINPSALDDVLAGPTSPPGYYGEGDVRRAVTLAPRLGALKPLGTLPAGSVRHGYEVSPEVLLGPWLVLGALLLFFLDTIATLLLRGNLTTGIKRFGAVEIIGIGISANFYAVSEAESQSISKPEAFALEAAAQTRLAYVVTGISEIDWKSQTGLAGLSAVVRQRTAVELGTPVPVHPADDELAFFPLLYWPVDARQRRLKPEANRRLNRYLKNGGTIFFDTLDQQFGGGTPKGRAALRTLTQGLNIPSLVPVPPDHVLTKAFYLIHDFPGRWSGGRLWVEGSKNRANDGVAHVIVGGHDWAAAWSVDAYGQNEFPVVPGGEKQREMAYRFGVNLIMYALTGNYKADQVHVPAILERLGQ
jgi:hypothetical protein